METKLSIREYQRSDKDKLILLMEETFLEEKMDKGQYFNAGYWEWQYLNNPYGESVLLLAEDNSFIIGQYPSVPLLLKVNNKTVLANSVIDLMVKKEYRRKGIFRRMGEQANRRLFELGIDISIAFPSRKSSYVGFINKLDWFEVGGLPLLVKPFFISLNGEKQKWPINEVQVSKIQHFPNTIDILWNEVSKDLKIAIVKDAQYLNWRYAQNPVKKYDIFMATINNQVAGYIVSRSVKIGIFKIGVIVDILAKELAVEALISRAMHEFKQAGLDFSVCLMLKNNIYYEALKKHGFIPLPRIINPKQYTLIARTNTNSVEREYIKNLNNWFIVLGDWDVL